MTDPNNLTPTAPVAPSTTPTPQPDPQDAIDQALGGMSPSSAEPTPTTIPEQPPVAPSAPEEPKKDLAESKAAGAAEGVVVPAELTEVAPAPTPTSQDPSLEVQSESPAPTPKSEPVPTETPSVEAKGDDVPLALVGETPAPVETAPTAPPVSMEPTAAVVPPAMLGSDEPKPVEKKKKKTSKIVLAIAGFFVMFGVVGLAAYQKYGSIEGLIAAIYEPKFIRDNTGKVIKNPDFDPNALIKNDQGELERQEDVRNRELGIKQEENSRGLPAEKAGSPSSCGTGYAWCGGGISKCVSFDALEDAGGGCNKYGEVVYDIPTVYGANGTPTADPKKCSVKGCSCGGVGYCFDKTGYCDQKEANSLGGIDGKNYNTMGLCAVVGSYSDPLDPNATFLPDTSTADSRYKCTDKGCTALGKGCFTMRYTCSDTVEDNSCTNTSTAFIKSSTPAQVGQTTSFEGKCGTVEQLDVSCGGYVTSRTKINPECGEKEEQTTTVTVSPSPSPSPGTPTLMCNSLTKAPTTTPKIGDKLTFTCAGSTVPAGATTLSYKFRYSINNGTYVNLVNKTATTAELTIAACGNYKVQCQACGILPNTRPTVGGGSETCDPIWSGAETL